MVDNNGLVVTVEMTEANCHDSKIILSLLDKATNNPLMRQQLHGNRLITKIRYVVERIFGNQARWFNTKTLFYCDLAKARTWHILLAITYNLKRLPKLFTERKLIIQT